MGSSARGSSSPDTVLRLTLGGPSRARSTPAPADAPVQRDAQADPGRVGGSPGPAARAQGPGGARGRDGPGEGGLEHARPRPRPGLPRSGRGGLGGGQQGQAPAPPEPDGRAQAARGGDPEDPHPEQLDQRSAGRRRRSGQAPSGKDGCCVERCGGYTEKALIPRPQTRGYSSAGRAPEWHSGGQRFDPA